MRRPVHWLALLCGLLATASQAAPPTSNPKAAAQGSMTTRGSMATQATAEAQQGTEGLINAPTAEVWRLFTTPDGYKLAGIPHAEVDLRVGGSLRSNNSVDGRLGDTETTVNEILAYEPERRLEMRIRQAPASFPYRQSVEGTRTVIYLTPAGTDMTLVKIVGLDYRDDAQSQAARALLAKDNRQTLDTLAKRYRPKCKLCEKEEQEAKQ